MQTPYPVVTIVAADVEDAEQIGTKPKFWLRRRRERCLLKELRGTRASVGPKVAEKIGQLLGMLCACKALAEFQGKHGNARLCFATTGRN